MNVSAADYTVFILFMSWLTQTITERLFGKPFELAGNQYSWLLEYVAMLVGVVLSFVVGLDLLHLAVDQLSPQPVEWTVWRHAVGIILSGVLLGGVSGLVNDFLKWFGAVKTARRQA